MEEKIKKRNRTFLNPTVIPMTIINPNEDSNSDDVIQVSSHEIGTIPYLRESALIFPGVDVSRIIAIPTMQHAKVDLVRYGTDVEHEKDRLLETVSTTINIILLLHHCIKLDYFSLQYSSSSLL